MREILFRGKLKSNGEWSFGNLNVSLRGTVIITPDETSIGKYGQVIPETVGQYAGLTDKNGKKIFEGDILKSESDGYIGVVKYNEIIASFIVEINDTKQDYYHWSPLNMGDPLREKQLKHTEIVDNIYDNPELLKGIKNVQL